MPLRVVEKDGYLYAVNNCAHCPFLWLNVIWQCSHKKGKGEALTRHASCIPVWCPLPEPGIKFTDKQRGLGIDFPNQKETEDA